jgi:hypothetical protein
MVYGAVAQLTPSHIAFNRDVSNIALIQLRHELGVGDFLVFAGIWTALNHSPENDGDRYQRHPQDHRFECRIH